MARPSIYDEAQVAEILRRLSGGESLRAICKDDGMPDESTVRVWALDDVNGFTARYGRARSIGIDAMVEEAMEIADDKADDPNSRRIRVDVRKWFASKMRPEKYSDRLAITGAKDSEPLRVLVEYDDKSVPE